MLIHNSVLYEMIPDYLTQLRKNLHRCKQILATMPEGSLVILHNKGYVSYYHQSSQGRKSLNAGDEDLRVKLAEKAYLRKYQKYAENEIAAIEAYLKKKDENIVSPTQYLCDHPAIYQLICSKLFGGNGDLTKWANAPYHQADFRPEGLSVRTAQGHLVRSKSECIIANALLSSGIPYRYEEISQFNGIEMRPDFQGYKGNGELFIWEHLGLLEKEEYMQNALWKIKNYLKAGFYPGGNLILTADTKSGQSIDSYTVKRIIDTFLM